MAAPEEEAGAEDEEESASISRWKGIASEEAADEEGRGAEGSSADDWDPPGIHFRAFLTHSETKRACEKSGFCGEGGWSGKDGCERPIPGEPIGLGGSARKQIT